MAERLRIGLLSAAHVHADGYAPILASMPDVELLGLADPDPARGKAFGRANGLAYLGSPEDLLDQHPDAVVITSENARHREDVEACAKAGVHILCEKPLATSAADARAIVDACASAGVLLMTAFPMRFSAPVRAVESAIREGEIGPVRAIAGVNQGQLPSRQRAWFADPLLAGGGALMDHVVHLADLYRWMLRAEVVEVFAFTNRILHADRAEVETGGLLLLTLSDGTFASIDCSWSRPDSYPTWGGLGMEIVGDRGILELDPFRQRFALHGEPGPAWTFWGSDPDRAMLRAFVDAVREGRQPPITGLDGLRAVEVIEAAYRSAESGEPVRIDSI
jgi:predicted dehydrogenase